ncbi:type VII secretion-associated serine protease mycosin [Actinoplanes sp. NPDC049265]|uniref:type VII secretion-associated serine protease mycosin n=1 Tax=Actinoplanes sp. NPDC049265 TaxID=3363902 RepID=UPI00371B1D72
MSRCLRATAGVFAGSVLAVGLPGTVAEAAPNPVTQDTIRSEQWHLRTLNVAGAWNWSQGAGVTVAVIDSGVDSRHVDLQGQVLPGLDLVDSKGDGDTDLVGHGTTVSAIIAGKDDDAGVVGIAPKAKILPVRVLDQENRYDDAMIVAKGVRWAVDHGARVINMSLGGSGSSAALAAAIDYAFAKDVVVVACTGNASASSSSGVWYPAREPGVIAVAGMERSGDVLWSGSITGPETVVTAPATKLVGASPSGYWNVQGTSFAAPMVSATAALIRSRWPTMPAGEVVNRIIKTARDRGPEGRDNKYGFGLVDPTGALTAELPTVADNPLDTSPTPGLARLGSARVSGSAQSAPNKPAPDTASDNRVPGKNAGAQVAAPPADDEQHNRGWWAAAAFFALSALVGVAIIRRFANVT